MSQGKWFQQLFVVLLFISTQLGFASETAPAVPGEFVVKLKNNFSAMSTNQLARVLQSDHVENVSVENNLVLVKRNILEREDFALQLMSAHPAVAYAEPNYIYTINAQPNDPQYSRLWGLSNSGHTAIGRIGLDIDAELAWNIQTGSRDIVVAVIDTGVDHTLFDLNPNMWTNEAELNGQAGVDDDGNGFVDDIYGYDFANNDGDPKDDHGHGSHCAGTIGAKGDNNQGIVGVAWNVRLMGIKYLTGSGTGSLANAVKSIDYAVKMKADILSNSWGGGGFSQALKESIERAEQAGVIFVAAAGNSTTDNDVNPIFPASYDVDNIIAVGAIDRYGNIAKFSSYGKTTVDLVAPGVEILSTTPGGFKSWSGTSMAAPHVSGVAALLMSNEPGITQSEVKQRLMDTAEPVSSVINKVATGGMVNAYYALVNQKAPANPGDPYFWNDKRADVIESPHPYPNNFSKEWTVTVPGAESVAVHFSEFETERGYDEVMIMDANRKLIAKWSGKIGPSFSPAVEGDTIIIKMISDESTSHFGFKVDYVTFR